MGLFSDLFGSSSSIEEKLKEIYVPMFQSGMGMSRAEAENTFTDMYDKVQKESMEDGTSELPDNHGDILLENEATDEETRTMLSRKRQDGMTDEDVRWWWNIHDYERRIMLEVDNLTRLAMFIDCEKKGMSHDDSAAKVRKHHPMYGNSDDTSNTTGDDRPLPYELKDRINIYIENKSRDNSKEFKKIIEESSTYNALVRNEIKAGNI